MNKYERFIFDEFADNTTQSQFCNNKGLLLNCKTGELSTDYHFQNSWTEYQDPMVYLASQDEALEGNGSVRDQLEQYNQLADHLGWWGYVQDEEAEKYIAENYDFCDTMTKEETQKIAERFELEEFTLEEHWQFNLRDNFLEFNCSSFGANLLQRLFDDENFNIADIIVNIYNPQEVEKYVSENENLEVIESRKSRLGSFPGYFWKVWGVYDHFGNLTRILVYSE